MPDESDLKVLIVDDNEVNLLVFERMLRGPGVDVVTAQNGPEGLELAEEHDLALILLDVQLPGMDGFKVARELKNIKRACHVPIIFVTAISQDDEHVSLGYKVGAVDYLFKPVDPNMLRSKVQVFLELHRQKLMLEREIAQRKVMERALLRAQEKYRNIFHQAVEGIYQILPEGAIIEANPAMARILGYDSEEQLMREVTDITSQLYGDASDRHRLMEQVREHGSVSNFECRFRRRDGELIWVSLSSRLVEDPDGSQFLEGLMQDINARKLSELDLQHRATYDVLTGIPNRYLFFDRLRHALAQAMRHHRMLAVLFIDLDNFKPVNDTHGHHMGDQLLRAVAMRIAGRVRASDTFARLGGDEFGVLLTEIDKESSATKVARSVIEHIQTPFVIEGVSCLVGASVGISLHPDHGREPDELVTNADKAMYLAKKAGGNMFRIYEKE